MQTMNTIKCRQTKISKYITSEYNLISVEGITLKVLTEISARHIHLCQEAINALFGKGYKLTPRMDLSQPGQFASMERLEIVGPRNSIKGVSVLGPLRGHTQVELSATDARMVGINTLIRESGKLSGTAGCTIIGPAGEYKIKEGVIIAKRHVHMSPDDAQRFKVKDSQIVSIMFEGGERSAIFGDFIVRVSTKYSLAAHIDTDEANAVGIKKEGYGDLLLSNVSKLIAKY